jgi:hypothetical protein
MVIITTASSGDGGGGRGLPPFPGLETAYGQLDASRGCISWARALPVTIKHFLVTFTLFSRLSQPQPYWHLGVICHLSQGPVLCTAECSARSLAFSLWMPCTLPPPSLWQSQISANVSKVWEPLSSSMFSTWSLPKWLSCLLFWMNKMRCRPGKVVNTCNPSYSGDIGKRIMI